MIDKINRISPRTCTDIYTILIDLDLFYELPPDKQNFIMKNKDAEYKFKFNHNIPLQFQIKSKETKVVLSYLFFKYINEDTKLKEYLINIYNKNEVKYQESLRKKYNPDNVFKNVQNEISAESKVENIENVVEEKEIKKEELMMVVKKETFFSQIIKKIRDFFKKNVG